MTGGFLYDRADRALQRFTMRDCMSAAIIMRIVIADRAESFNGRTGSTGPAEFCSGARTVQPDREPTTCGGTRKFML